MSAHVDPAAFAASSGPARHAMLVHLSGCGACRLAAAEQDPAILFSLLALAPVPETILDAVSLEVAHRAGRDGAPLGALAWAARWPRLAASAAVLALALVCGYATLREAPATPPVLSQSRPRADVEVESGRGVSQVIDLTVGETQIVMVYNGDLKL